MSTHNICFSREIRKILCGYPFLSVAMSTPKICSGATILTIALLNKLMPRPFLISCQSDYLIQVFDRNSHI